MNRILYDKKIYHIPERDKNKKKQKRAKNTQPNIIKSVPIRSKVIR